MSRSLRCCVVALATAAFCGQTGAADSLDDAFERDVLIIETAGNGCFKFDIHIAVSRSQQQRGLMFVRELPEWSGMLFVYLRPGIRSMWMKNTYVPLDILFAREDGTVSSIEADTEPLSLESISAVEPVQYVLELNAGTAARLGIDGGSRLILDEIGSE